LRWAISNNQVQSIAEGRNATRRAYNARLRERRGFADGRRFIALAPYSKKLFGDWWRLFRSL
jgi:hypothetical protein